MPSDREQLLDRIYSRGNRLRRRRHVGTAAAATLALVAVVLVPVSLIDGGEGGSNLTSTGRDEHLTTETSTSTAAESTNPTGPSSTDTTVGSETATTVGPPTTFGEWPPTSAPAPTTLLVCRNSVDPRCGPFYWDPQPTNQPMDLSITPTYLEIDAGEEAVITIVATDDAQPLLTCYWEDDPWGLSDTWWGDSDYIHYCPVPTCMLRETPHGPWDPVPPEPGRLEKVLRHKYVKPGVYHLDIQVDSGPRYCSPYPPFADDIYGDVTNTDVTIVVH